MGVAAERPSKGQLNNVALVVSIPRHCAGRRASWFRRYCRNGRRDREDSVLRVPGGLVGRYANGPPLSLTAARHSYILSSPKKLPRADGPGQDQDETMDFCDGYGRGANLDAAGAKIVIGRPDF